MIERLQYIWFLNFKLCRHWCTDQESCLRFPWQSMECSNCPKSSMDSWIWRFCHRRRSLLSDTHNCSFCFCLDRHTCSIHAPHIPCSDFLCRQCKHLLPHPRGILACTPFQLDPIIRNGYVRCSIGDCNTKPWMFFAPQLSMTYKITASELAVRCFALIKLEILTVLAIRFQRRALLVFVVKSEESDTGIITTIGCMQKWTRRYVPPNLGACM